MKESKSLKKTKSSSQQTTTFSGRTDLEKYSEIDINGHQNLLLGQTNVLAMDRILMFVNNGAALQANSGSFVQYYENNKRVSKSFYVNNEFLENARNMQGTLEAKEKALAGYPLYKDREGFAPILTVWNIGAEHRYQQRSTYAVGNKEAAPSFYKSLSKTNSMFMTSSASKKFVVEDGRYAVEPLQLTLFFDFDFKHQQDLIADFPDYMDNLKKDLEALFSKVVSSVVVVRSVSGLGFHVFVILPSNLAVGEMVDKKHRISYTNNDYKAIHAYIVSSLKKVATKSDEAILEGLDLSETLVKKHFAISSSCYLAELIENGYILTTSNTKKAVVRKTINVPERIGQIENQGVWSRSICLKNHEAAKLILGAMESIEEKDMASISLKNSLATLVVAHCEATIGYTGNVANPILIETNKDHYSAAICHMKAVNYLCYSKTEDRKIPGRILSPTVKKAAQRVKQYAFAPLHNATIDTEMFTSYANTYEIEGQEPLIAPTEEERSIWAQYSSSKKIKVVAVERNTESDEEEKPRLYYSTSEYKEYEKSISSKVMCIFDAFVLGTIKELYQNIANPKTQYSKIYANKPTPYEYRLENSFGNFLQFAETESQARTLSDLREMFIDITQKDPLENSKYYRKVLTMLNVLLMNSENLENSNYEFELSTTLITEMFGITSKREAMMLRLLCACLFADTSKGSSSRVKGVRSRTFTLSYELIGIIKFNCQPLIDKGINPMTGGYKKRMEEYFSVEGCRFPKEWIRYISDEKNYFQYSVNPIEKIRKKAKASSSSSSKPTKEEVKEAFVQLHAEKKTFATIKGMARTIRYASESLSDAIEFSKAVLDAADLANGVNDIERRKAEFEKFLRKQEEYFANKKGEKGNMVYSDAWIQRRRGKIFNAARKKMGSENGNTEVYFFFKNLNPAETKKYGVPYLVEKETGNKINLYYPTINGKDFNDINFSIEFSDTNEYVYHPEAIFDAYSSNIPTDLSDEEFDAYEKNKRDTYELISSFERAHDKSIEQEKCIRLFKYADFDGMDEFEIMAVKERCGVSFSFEL